MLPGCGAGPAEVAEAALAEGVALAGVAAASGADVASEVGDLVVAAAGLAADIWVGAGVKAPKHHTTIAANHF